ETCALQEFAPVGHAEPPSFNRLCMSKGRVSAGVPSNAGTDESSSRSTLPGRNVPLAGATVTEGSGAQSESIDSYGSTRPDMDGTPLALANEIADLVADVLFVPQHVFGDDQPLRTGPRAQDGFQLGPVHDHRRG